MTQEEKQLLLADLCARLPHGVIINITCEGINYNKTLDFDDIKSYSQLPPNSKTVALPYLRPMSSMTENERKEYGKFCELDTEILANHPMNGEPFPALYNSQDWLNAHHFDYRGLIEKGLAIEAPKVMY